MRPHRISVPSFLALVLLMPQFLLAQYDVNTVAGGGPNNLAALRTSVGYPGSIAFDSAGNTYIADSYSSHIFKVNTTGTVTVVAGNGTLGYSGDGGPATSAALNGPEGVFLDGAGNIFIADTQNSVIREVSASTGNIATVAGSATLGSGYSGDAGPATSAQLNDPFGIFVDGAGNIFIADADNCLIRKVSGGNISTIAGNPALPQPCGYSGDGGLATSAQLDVPEGVFVDGSGNVFIADAYNNLIRVVNTGTAQITIAGVAIAPNDIQTVAGAYYVSEGGTDCEYTGDSGPAVAAQLCAPDGVFVDGSENIFIADTNNTVIREVASGGTITTVAGDGTLGYSGDAGPAISAELNYPSGIVVDGTGDIFIADTDNSVIREVTAGTMGTIIGNNFLAYSGDGGSPLNAELNYPGGIFVDGSEDIFIADTVNSVIREVVVASGDIQTLAGNGTPCPQPPTTVCGDGGLAASAQLNNPDGVFVDGAGNIFIADTSDNRIRVVNTGAAAVTIATVVIQPGDIATVAGSGTQGYAGDGAAAVSAELDGPVGVFVDSAENIFIADTSNHAIREVVASSGIINTVAGNGTQCSSPSAGCGDGGAAISAQLADPNGVFLDASENIYIADAGDNRIRVVNTSTQAVSVAGVSIPPGNIATVAGTGTEGYSGDGAAATSALLAGPGGVFVDSSGDIFIADTANFVVREVLSGDGFIATVAGSNTQGFSGDGGESTSAQFNSAYGLFGDSAGNLFVADTDNSRVRELVLTITAPSATVPAAQTASPGGTATYSIQLNANTGDPKYAITLSCLQSSLPANSTCSFSPSTITPGPLPVPFRLTVTIPTGSGLLEKPNGMRLGALAFAFTPLTGILLTCVGRRNRQSRWLWVGALCVFLVLLNACGGGSSSAGSGSGTTYNIQIQGTTTAHPAPVTITTVALTVQ
ncbi:MAG: hypothetical protein ABSE28_07215 [Candidatus Sulfotelmatobacter sp.]